MTLRKDGDSWGSSSMGRAPALQAGGRGIVALLLHFMRPTLVGRYGAANAALVGSTPTGRST